MDDNIESNMTLQLDFSLKVVRKQIDKLNTESNWNWGIDDDGMTYLLLQSSIKPTYHKLQSSQVQV